MGLPGGPETSNALYARELQIQRRIGGTDRLHAAAGLDQNQMERLASLDFVRKGDT